MYKVTRDANGVSVTDWKGQVVYSSDLDSIVVAFIDSESFVSTVKDLTDLQLVKALAFAERINLEPSSVCAAAALVCAT